MRAVPKSLGAQHMPYRVKVHILLHGCAFKGLSHYWDGWGKHHLTSLKEGDWVSPVAAE